MRSVFRVNYRGNIILIAKFPRTRATDDRCHANPVRHRARRPARRLKRGRDRRRVALDGVAAPDPDERLLALDEALTQLAGADPLAARVVEMHHFAGMSHEQVATALDVSVYLARQKWTFARAWLKTTLGES